MISKTLEKAINKQINEELFSAYLYTSMQAWFADESLDGMANWMKAQSEEEHFHAMKFFNYLIERGGKVELDAIAKPDVDFGSPLKAFQAALEHERYITKCINEMMDLAIAENDHATRIFLDWFVEEQVEEEDSVDTIVQRLARIGDHMHGIYMLDRELSDRSFDPEDED